MGQNPIGVLAHFSSGARSCSPAPQSQYVAGLARRRLLQRRDYDDWWPIAIAMDRLLTGAGSLTRR
ncbi:MAG: hypothetical protein OXK79_13205 [Chloroflexota bacterium]|nr:hypothetical protein [Chloroflexota bacterium]